MYVVILQPHMITMDSGPAAEDANDDHPPPNDLDIAESDTSEDYDDANSRPESPDISDGSGRNSPLMFDPGSGRSSPASDNVVNSLVDLAYEAEQASELDQGPDFNQISDERQKKTCEAMKV